MPNGTTRDLLNHSAGKGDANRSKQGPAWERKFRKLRGMGTKPTEAEGFQRVGNRMVKRYG